MGDHPALLMVDAVSGLAAVDLRMDEWGLDVVVSASQKAFMTPPGLSFMAFNDRAYQAYKTNTNSRYYWDLAQGMEYLQKGQTPFTPPISLIYGMQEALKMMAEEGLDNIIARHTAYRDMVRGSVRAMGLDLLAQEDCASPAVTSVLAPAEIGANPIRKYMLDNFNIILSGGQQRLDNVIFRIGHLGYIRELDLLAVLAALEITLTRFGFLLEMGAGLKTAQQAILKMHQR
jgi:aspartate aminotransferase-like enzyme